MMDNCNGLRNKVLSMFRSSQFNHVGRFGNSDPDVLSDWVKTFNTTLSIQNQVNKIYSYCTSLYKAISLLSYYISPVLHVIPE